MTLDYSRQIRRDVAAQADLESVGIGGMLRSIKFPAPVSRYLEDSERYLIELEAHMWEQVGDRKEISCDVAARHPAVVAIREAEKLLRRADYFGMDDRELCAQVRKEMKRREHNARETFDGLEIDLEVP